MNSEELEDFLGTLKSDLIKRPDKIQYHFIIHIDNINACINKHYSYKDIYNFLFFDDKIEKIRPKYMADIIYRARKKAKSNKIDNRSVQNEKSEVKSSIKIEKSEANNKPMNAFERLKERQKNSQNSSVNHNSGSSMEDVEKSFARFNIE